MEVRRYIMYGVACVAIMYGSSAYALGLGEIHLESALNQPLRASIVLHGSEGLNSTDIAVSLADTEMFEKFGIERPHFLSSLRFIPVAQGNNLLVQVQSSVPVVEPYLNFLVQLKRPNGTLVREYTMLFDPPLYQPTAVVGAIPAVSSIKTNEIEKTNRQRSPASSPRPTLPDLKPHPQAKQYPSRSGDNLWSIAQATRADESVSVRRQMLAIRSLNPDAFVAGDMNQLRAGRQLILPTAQQVGVKLQAAAGQFTADSNLPLEASNEVKPAAATEGRLRIAESREQLSSENAQLQQRMNTLESRFGSLLDELNARDRQIASLQAELDILRRARDAEVGSQDPTLEPAIETENAKVDDATVVSAAAIPGALPMDKFEATLSSKSPWQTSIMNWWPLLVVFLGTLVGVIIFRLRRHQNDASSLAFDPIPANTPLADQDADVLKGVALYLAYDRHIEAKELLDRAIDDEPQRMDLRLRQLSLVAQLGDAQGFAEQERKLRSMGAEAGQIDPLKARLFAVIDSTAADNSLSPDDYAEHRLTSSIAGNAQIAETPLLGEEEFSLDAGWDLIDGVDPRSTRLPSQGASESFEDSFETNLNDYPEVKEVDEGAFEHLIKAQKKSDDL